MWTSVAILTLLLAVRFSPDPRCLVVLQPHEHGCHAVMILAILGIAGIALVFFSRSRQAV